MIKSDIKIIFPLFIFLIGPPAFRSMFDEFHSSSGSIDFWMIIKIISYFYILIFFLKLSISNKYNDLKTNLNNDFIINFLFSIIFLSFIISSLLGDNTVYSLFYTTLYFMGFYFYYNFSKLFIIFYSKNLINLISLIRNIFIGIIIITIIISMIYPDIVGVREIGGIKKITGNKVSDFKFIPMITFIISLYFYLNINKGSSNAINLLCIAISLLALYYSQTRSIIYTSIIISFFTLFFYLINRSKNNLNIKKKFLFFYIIIIFLLLIPNNFILDVLTRSNTVNITDMSGRGFIWKFIVDLMKENFFGYGMGSGFKDIFTKIPNFYLGNTDKLLITKGIGNSHNFYLDFLVAGGWIAFFSIIFIHIIIIFRCIKNYIKYKSLSSIILFVLFTSTSLVSFFDSFALIPTSNTFAFYWILIALISTEYRKENINEKK